jgi:hypothetical protein
LLFFDASTRASDRCAAEAVSFATKARVSSRPEAAAWPYQEPSDTQCDPDGYFTVSFWSLVWWSRFLDN